VRSDFSPLVIAGFMAILFGCAPAISNQLPASGRLPHSLKGYELYSWQRVDSFSFVLITGTNRTKTVEELTRKGDDGSTDDFVRIISSGTDSAKGTLRRLPKGEAMTFSGTVPGYSPVHESIMKELMDYCNSIGLVCN